MSSGKWATSTMMMPLTFTHHFPSNKETSWLRNKTVSSLQYSTFNATVLCLCILEFLSYTYQIQVSLSQICRHLFLPCLFGGIWILLLNKITNHFALFIVFGLVLFPFEGTWFYLLQFLEFFSIIPLGSKCLIH